MSYVRIWTHAVWGTKNKFPYLTKEVRSNVIGHVKENAKKKEIFIDTINGHLDHLHCLLALNADHTISNTMQLIKGEAAYWINKEKLTNQKFEWSDKYFAVSVSESMVKKVREYINNQEEHHKNVSFEEEYQKFISAYGFGQG